MLELSGHSRFAAALAALCCLGVCSCGAGAGVSATGRSSSAAASTGAASYGGNRVSGFIAGDYDKDDIEGSRYSDADNDDSTQRKDADNDFDSAGSGYYDGDDRPILRFGRAAGGGESRAVGALVRRYYAAAVAGDGAAGCSTLAPTVARSAVEGLGRPPGPPYYRGGTCAAVLSRLFAVNRPQLVAHAHALSAVSARVAGDSGIAVLRFGGLPGRSLRLARVRGVWRLDTLVDEELP